MGRLRKSLLELASRVRGRPGDWARRFDAWDTSIRGRTAATWGILRTRQGMTVSALALALLAFVAIDYATFPPPLPGYAHVRAAWRPSEAWLYDRNGVLIDSARVNFAARRLAWTPLPQVSPVTRDTIVGVEDRRFFHHGGVDRMAASAARSLGLEVVAVPVSAEDRRRSTGRNAPILRTLRLLDEHPDLELALVWWDGTSPGTRFTLAEAARRKIPVELYQA